MKWSTHVWTEGLTEAQVEFFPDDYAAHVRRRPRLRMSIIRPRGAHKRHSIPLWVVLLVPGPAVFLLVDGFAARAGWVAVPVMLLLAFAVRYYIRREVRDTEGQNRAIAAGTASQEPAIKNPKFRS